MKKAVFFWIISVVLVVAAVFGLLLSGGNGILGILFLALLFLALFGGGITATITTLRAAGGGDASEKWLEANQWEKPLSLKYDNLSLYFNNQSGELAIFDRRESKKAPARILAYQEITNSGVYQENAKGNSSIQLVIQLVSGEPYVIAVTNGTPPSDSPEVQAALAFAFGGKEGPPQGWSRVDAPGQLLGEPLLSAAARGPALIRREENGFLLAYRYEPDSPFPLTPLFCFARLMQLNGRDYLCFPFRPGGCPRLEEL